MLLAWRMLLLQKIPSVRQGMLVWLELGHELTQTALEIEPSTGKKPSK